MSVTPNPYAPPSAHVADVYSPGTMEEEVRRAHIKHEASIRAVGFLYLLSGAFLALGGTGLLVATSAVLRDERSMLAVLGVGYLAGAAVSIVTGIGIRRLRPWARIVSIVLSAIGLLGFPVGTLIHGYILYLMLAAKGRRIFAADYPGIVAATPHVKYKTSIVVWILLAVLILGIVAAVVVATMNG
jgi:hypothetical protein